VFNVSIIMIYGSCKVSTGFSRIENIGKQISIMIY